MVRVSKIESCKYYRLKRNELFVAEAVGVVTMLNSFKSVLTHQLVSNLLEFVSFCFDYCEQWADQQSYRSTIICSLTSLSFTFHFFFILCAYLFFRIKFRMSKIRASEFFWMDLTALIYLMPLNEYESEIFILSEHFIGLSIFGPYNCTFPSVGFEMRWRD